MSLIQFGCTTVYYSSLQSFIQRLKRDVEECRNIKESFEKLEHTSLICCFIWLMSYERMILNLFFDKELIVLFQQRHSCSFIQCTCECWTQWNSGHTRLSFFVPSLKMIFIDLMISLEPLCLIVRIIQTCSSKLQLLCPLACLDPDLQSLKDLQSLSSSRVWMTFRV